MPDWGRSWTTRCRVLGGTPTREMFLEAVGKGTEAVPTMVEVLSHREYREGEPADCALLPVHAMRVLAAVGAASAIPALLNVLNDAVDPGLYGEEAALALAHLGEAALAPVEGVLLDHERGTWERATASRALLFAAILDRRLRRRVRSAYERLLTAPLERDRIVCAHVVGDACLMSASPLLPAIELAFGAGRVETDIIDADAARTNLFHRRHRPDAETKAIARRDVLEDYASWEDLAEGLEPAERAGYEAALERAERGEIDGD